MHEINLQRISREALRAEGLHPKFNSPHEAYAVIKEEEEEFWDAIKANDLEHARLEVTQLGAMCLRYLNDFPPGTKPL